jgi:8-oxo-dGTP pyrophosphatase MutT (NUDIX family)
LADERAELMRLVSSALTQSEPAERAVFVSAAVAVILADSPEGYKVLLIRRPEGTRDPWSGHVALPGGRVAESDGSFEATAARETREEVGIELPHSNYLGYLGKFQTQTRGMWVVPSVFASENIPAVTPSSEVASYAWVPLSQILSDRSRSKFVMNREGVNIVFPAFTFGDYLVWGLTERILSALVDAARKGASHQQ